MAPAISPDGLEKKKQTPKPNSSRKKSKEKGTERIPGIASRLGEGKKRKTSYFKLAKTNPARETM